jgi:hypothetical protein
VSGWISAIIWTANYGLVTGPGWSRWVSEAEEILAWQLKCAQVRFIREFVFHPTRKWRLDFVIIDTDLAVEVEGGAWVSGRHTRPLGFSEDCLKYSEAAVLGWRILHVTPQHVIDGEALDLIERAIAKDRERL